MRERILGLIGMMRKASALALGEENTEEAIAKGKAKLLLLPKDTGEKARMRAERCMEGRNVCPIELPFTREELASAVGIGGCSMAAVTDLGFANALMKLLTEEDPEKYRPAAEEVRKRFEKVQRRKIEKPGAKAKKKTAGGK